MSVKLSKSLPKFNITSISLSSVTDSSIPVVCEWLSVLQGLNSISLNLSDCNEKDYLLYQRFQDFVGLKKISLECYSLTEKGWQELYKFIITAGSTLESMDFKCHPLYVYPGLKCKLSQFYGMLEVDKLLNFALSSSKVSNLSTNFGHKVLTASRRIECINFTIHLRTYLSDTTALELLRSFQYLSCIAEMYRVKPIQCYVQMVNQCARGIELDVKLVQFLCDFIVILNDALQSLTICPLYYMGRITFPEGGCFNLKKNPCCCNCTARALRRDPAVPRHNLRRSQSLCGLRTPLSNIGSTRSSRKETNVFQNAKKTQVFPVIRILSVMS